MGGGKESTVSKDRLLLTIQAFYSFHNEIVPAIQIGRVRAISPSRTATKLSNKWYFWEQAFFTVFFSLNFWHKGEPIVGGGWVHSLYIYIFTVHLYLKYTPQRASTLSPLQQQTMVPLCVCVCVWRPAPCGGGLLEDVGCALPTKQSKNLYKLHFIT